MIVNRNQLYKTIFCQYRYWIMNIIDNHCWAYTFFDRHPDYHSYFIIAYYSLLGVDFYAIFLIGSWIFMIGIVACMFWLGDMKTTISISLLVTSHYWVLRVAPLSLLVHQYPWQPLLVVYFGWQTFLTIDDTVALIG